MVKEGDIIPKMELIDHNGNKITIGDGKNYTVLYFYPKDDTPGCTKQGINFTNLKEEFEKLNVQIIGVSRDSIESHQKFAKKYNLNIHLVSDKEKKLATIFGVEGKLMFSRDTIILDPNGKVIKIYRKVNAQTNPYEVLEFIKNFIFKPVN
ncbi:MAG: peroxiredoxin [bacterium]|jgi:peroxiredoxin Q/BCP